MSERVDTKSRILDVAERLFGLNGFEVTSLRDITAEAQVNLAAVNYHFQSKDGLIEAVIARRVEAVNRRRFEMLETLRPSPSLEGILVAFLAPVLEQQFQPAVALLARVISGPNKLVEKKFKNSLLLVSRRFQEEIGKALPDLPLVDRHWCIHFAGGVLTQILNLSQRLPEISGCLCNTTARRAVTERAVGFLAAGFRSAVPDAAGPTTCRTEALSQAIE
jgi:AcrR family transcriptional regulator